MSTEKEEIDWRRITSLVLVFVVTGVAVYGLVSIDNLAKNDVFAKDTTTYQIPNWVKHNAYWYSQDLITAEEFSLTIEYLIDEGLIKVNDEVG